MLQKKDKLQVNVGIIERNPDDLLLWEDYIYDNFLSPNICRYTSLDNFDSQFPSSLLDLNILIVSLDLEFNTYEKFISRVKKYIDFCPVITFANYTESTFAIGTLSAGISDYLIKDEVTSYSLYKSIIYSLERYKNMSRIRKSQKLYSDLFNLTPIPMWVYDKNSLGFLDVNLEAVNSYDC